MKVAALEVVVLGAAIRMGAGWRGGHVFIVGH
jgi:hypothetical protein